MSIKHRKYDFISSIFRMRTGNRPLVQSNAALKLIRNLVKQLNLTGSFVFAKTKYSGLPIFLLFLKNINNIVAKSTTVNSHSMYRFSPRSLSVKLNGVAHRVVKVAELISYQFYHEASNRSFSLTFDERSTESRLPESQLRSSNFMNYGLLIEAASAASVSRASATSRCGVLRV